MSGMMLHGLGDCTPELNCGCMAKSPRDELRERIARALLKCGGWDVRVGDGTAEANEMADAVIEALGLEFRWVHGWSCLDEGEPCPRMVAGGGACKHRYRSGCWVTPWERIEEDR